MRVSRVLQGCVLGLAGYASSCAVPRPETPQNLASSPASTLVFLEPTVVDPASLPTSVGPLPYNASSDLDRAGILAEGAADSGEIALTFDDGPGAETTSEVLRILAAHNVKGAFFLTGRRLGGDGVVAEMNRSMVRAIAAAGHTIGNHGLDHLGVNRKDLEWNSMQIEDSARLITDTTGAPVRYFRPPFGKIGPPAQSILALRRDELVMWTIDAQDTRETDPERIRARLIAQIVYAGQGIVLLHDLRGPSVRALAMLLDWLEAHPRSHGVGYTVVDLPTYLAHAAARPWPHSTRLDLYHAREKLHALERRPVLASKPKLRQPLATSEE